MEENNARNTSRKIKFGLAPKFIIGFVLIIIAITVAAIIVGLDTYTKSITDHYNTVAYQTAHVAEGYFTRQELTDYAELARKFDAGEISKSELDTVMESDRYREIWEYIDKLRRSMGANDIFVSWCDIEELTSYTPEKAEAKEWKPIVYIMDSYYEPSLQFAIGDRSPVYPDYRKDIEEAARTGQPFERKIITNYQFGYILTASYPVSYGGAAVAFINVEIPMLTLESDITEFVVRVLIVSGIIMAVLLAIGAFAIVQAIIKPIIVAAAEAEKFVGHNAEISDKLGKIKTRDEIQLLSESLLRMEIDIKDYIENITKITAEKERIGAELNVATQIQADMLPSIFPPFPGRKEFDIFATMTPAKEVGGDFYDFFLIDDDHLALVMADVSGKGVPAALFMVIAKTLIKNHAQLGELSPAKVLMQANEQLCEGNKAELFVTVWLGILEISTGKGMAANAGHEHPVIRRSGGKYELVEYRHSPAVATMEGIRFREHEFELHPGDSLFVYTDGVAEATDAHNELYGTDRMLEALNSVEYDAPQKDVLRALKASVDTFVGEAPQFDDITMLGFRYYGSAGNE